VFISSILEFELFLGARTDRHINDLELIFSQMDVPPFDFGCGRIAATIWHNLESRHQHVEGWEGDTMKNKNETNGIRKTSISMGATRRMGANMMMPRCATAQITA
jgi:hypothetical protein